MHPTSEGDTFQNGKRGLRRSAGRTNLLDASALVKLVVVEDRGEKLRNYLRKEAGWYTTPFCFYEALGALKVKYLYRKEISEQEFGTASFSLMAEYRASARVYDMDLTEPSVFTFTQELAKGHGLDLSDAFQITSILKGCPFARDSMTVLITDDKRLARAARQHDCPVWYLPDDPPE